MLGQQFYHETTRKVVVAFGTLLTALPLFVKITAEQFNSQ